MHDLLLIIAATRGAAAATAFGETRVPAAARGRLSRRGRPRGREVLHERRYVTAPLTTPGERYRPADAETEAGSREDGGAAWGRGARRPGLFREEARGAPAHDGVAPRGVPPLFVAPADRRGEVVHVRVGRTSAAGDKVPGGASLAERRRRETVERKTCGCPTDSMRSGRSSGSRWTRATGRGVRPRRRRWRREGELGGRREGRGRRLIHC